MKKKPTQRNDAADRDVVGDVLPVIVVGAGVAGLACAVALHDLGQPVVVLEATDRVGGRLKTDRTPEGYLIDHGFQVLLDAYPSAKKWVTVDGLRTQPFDAGAQIWTGKRLVPLANPLLHPESALRDLTVSLLSLTDKLRLAKLAWTVKSAHWGSAREAAAAYPGLTAEEFLWEQGFSRGFVDRFARPFWGGITLDPTLRQSVGPVLFTLKMFLDGRAVLPAEGVAALPEAMAAELPESMLKLNARVDDIVIEEGRAVGVRIGNTSLRGSAVVVAADAPHARNLTRIESLPPAADGLGSVTVFLAGVKDPGIGPRLVINGSGTGVVNHLAPLSAAQPTYAPIGHHLVAAVAVGDALRNDKQSLVRAALIETAVMLGHSHADWSVVAVRDVPFSQFAQGPGCYAQLPENRTSVPGLYLASEATVDSSYNGAILSGEAAARLVIQDTVSAASAR